MKLSLVNALNQNVGVTQNVNANSLQQETINSLGRYVMLSFTYSLSKIANPISNKSNNRRMIMGGL
jgi:hydrogenase maturation factor